MLSEADKNWPMSYPEMIGEEETPFRLVLRAVLAMQRERERRETKERAERREREREERERGERGEREREERERRERGERGGERVYLSRY